MENQAMQKGFNSGYNLKGTIPKQADCFIVDFKDRKDDYAHGFLADIKERERELFRDEFEITPFPQKVVSIEIKRKMEIVH